MRDEEKTAQSFSCEKQRERHEHTYWVTIFVKLKRVRRKGYVTLAAEKRLGER